MRDGFVLLLLVGTVSLAYVPLLADPGLDFVFDDFRFVRNNESIRDLGHVVSWFTDPETVDPTNWAGIYRPLRTLDFALDWAVFGPSPFWFHVKSLLWHVIGSILVVLLFGRFGAGRRAAFLGGFLFALHPVQVESAGWITSRGDVLCLVFFLAALLLHHGSRGLDLRFAGAAFALVLALLSKEVAVMFAAAALLSDFFFRDGRRWRTTLKRWPKYLGYALLAGIYAGIWLHLHDARHAAHWHIFDRWGGSLFGTVLTMSRGFVYYARLVLFPVDMAQDFYVVPVSFPDLLTVLCLLAVGGLLAFSLMRLFRGGGLLSFAVLWSFVTIFPCSNLPGPIGIPTAERFLYLPMVGICLALATLLGRMWRGAGRPAVFVLLLCLFAVTADRARVWANDDSLWKATVSRFDSPRGLEWMAHVYRDRGEFGRALAMHDRQFRLWERLPVPEDQMLISRAERALVLVGLGRSGEALAEAESILAARPGLPAARHARAAALDGLGRLDEARVEIEGLLAAEKDRRYRETGARIYQHLAGRHEKEGREGLSFLCLKRSVEIHPLPSVAAELSRRQAAYTKAYRALEHERARDPRRLSIRLAIAELQARHGRFRDAIRGYRGLLREETSPRDPEILLSFARHYWEAQDTPAGYAAAVRIYEELLRDHPAFSKERGVAGRLSRCRELSKPGR